ncbi:BNR-4 repeat-containing protein [Actinomycetes bacterium KLBMP 9797]
MSFTLITHAWAPRADAGVVSQLDIAPVWSVHPTGLPVLLTTGARQYVAYYDRDRYLTVAHRLLTGGPTDQPTWSYRRFTDIRSTWQTGAHHAIAMQIDSQDRIHLAAAMHGEALKYYRMTAPHSFSSFRRFRSMVGTDETQVTYPKFLTDPAGNLYFTYRSGISGKGAQLINRFDAARGTWRPLVKKWFDGTGGRRDASAYVEGPTLGPDGNFHVVWVWRDSPDVSTNHHVSYAKSADLVNWTTVSGRPVTLPFTPRTPGVVVDPVGVHGGLMNGFTKVGFDSGNRATVTYIKYDTAGHSQLYSARYQAGAWNIVQGTDWDYRWSLRGTGAIPFDIVLSKGLAGSDQPGTLRIDFTHVQYGVGRLVLDETTLRRVAVQPASAIERWWPASLDEPETVNPPRPMSVGWIGDAGTPGGYVLRREHGPNNRDSAVPRPWPGPAALRVIRLNGDDRPFTSDNLARGAEVTYSSSDESSGWGATRLVDGKVFPVPGNGGYSSAGSPIDRPEWVTVDLGAPRTVNAVSLFPATAEGYGMPVDFTIDTSTDNVTWTTHVVRTDAPLTAGQQDFALAPTEATYIRVNATSLRAGPADDDYRLRLAELQVFEVASLAEGSPVSASSSYEAHGWSAVKAVNGVTDRGGGGWSSNDDLTVNHQESLTVDLGAPTSVSRVNLYPAASGDFYPLSFAIEVSEDGIAWTTATTRTDEPVPSTCGSYGFAPRTARYVRLTATSLRQWSGEANRYRAQLAEFEVKP